MSDVEEKAKDDRICLALTMEALSYDGLEGCSTVIPGNNAFEDILRVRRPPYPHRLLWDYATEQGSWQRPMGDGSYPPPPRPTMKVLAVYERDS